MTAQHNNTLYSYSLFCNNYAILYYLREILKQYASGTERNCSVSIWTIVNNTRQSSQSYFDVMMFANTLLQQDSQTEWQFVCRQHTQAAGNIINVMHVVYSKLYTLLYQCKPRSILWWSPLGYS